MVEWLPSLGAHSKWRQDRPDVAVGDVVLVVSSEGQRGHWPIGRVTAVYPGPDGRVRTTDVLIAGQTYRRPVVRLCPLGV